MAGSRNVPEVPASYVDLSYLFFDTHAKTGAAVQAGEKTFSSCTCLENSPFFYQLFLKCLIF
jgi:hypothetical protein